MKIQLTQEHLGGNQCWIEGITGRAQSRFRQEVGFPQHRGNQSKTRCSTSIPAVKDVGPGKELTVLPWKENCEKAHERKSLKYADLMADCKDKDWSVGFFLQRLAGEGSQRNRCGSCSHDFEYKEKHIRVRDHAILD